MKILNLYAGIGGNRKLWTDCEVTAVEYDPNVAAVYKSFFPNDTVIVGDAHQYLIDHYKEFDFIWASPPCPSHSRIREMGAKRGLYPPIYPDLKLYEEIIFLENYFDGTWVIENVIPYYTPLIPPKKIVDRHCFWASFNIGSFDKIKFAMKESNIADLELLHGFDLSKYDVPDKLKMLRNCVHPSTGLYIFNCARGIIESKNVTQNQLF